MTHGLVLLGALAGTIACIGAPPAHAAVTSPRIGMVADTNGLFDRSFNELAAAAVRAAAVQLGARIDIRASLSTASYVPALRAMAAQGYDLVIAVGPSEEEAVGEVAREYPDVAFAIVDDSYASTGIGGRPNVEGLLFEEQQSGYLVGYLAGLMELTRGPRLNPSNIVSSVAGGSSPSVARYLAGYRAGARRADPGVRVLLASAGAVGSTSRCYSLARAQIAAGSDIVFQVAGTCGLGVIQAANEARVWSIGSDSDQSYLGPSVMASAVDRADRAVFLAIAAVRHGAFHGGRDVVFGIAQHATGIAGISSAVPEAFRRRLTVIASRLRAGRITVPTALGTSS